MNIDKTKEDLKELVKMKYSEIAASSKSGSDTCCCGCTPSSGNVDYTIFSDDYSGNQGYNPDADLGLGCGIPTEFADLQPGDKVLDLGSGAGNDCFVARSLVGESGMVTGLDFSDAMLEKARENNLKLGFPNIEFVKGDIEEMPFEKNSFNVILSNCVLNLVPDKKKAFAEMFRVLLPGGCFCVSDVVIQGVLPGKLKENAEMYAGCVSGAINMEEYLEIIHQAGFQDINIHKKKSIDLPEPILSNFLSAEEIKAYQNGNNGIFSITVSAKKEKSA